MAISTYKTFLMKNSSPEAGSWTKVIDIKSFPDLGGSPEMLETTTLSDRMQTYIPGIQSSEALEFEANYSLTDYQALVTLGAKEEEYAVWFGGNESGNTVTPTGDQGKFKFKGTLSVKTTGGGVNEPVGMTITIAPSTPITFDGE